MKHSLQLKLSQHLTLTPQLQQSIRLLQLSTLELNQEIERFLQENPLLERDEGAEDEGGPAAPANTLTTEYTNSTTSTSSTSEKEEESPRNDIPEADAEWRDDGGGPYSGHDDGEDSEFPQLAADSPSLREHLLWQINLLQCPHRDKRVGAMLVDTLDGDGHMTPGLEELAAMFSVGVGPEPSQ